MALSDPFELDPTSPNSNSNYAGANIAEGCAPSGINNATRALGSMLAKATSYQSPAISSSVSTNIAAAGTGYYMAITGANAINSFGVVPGAQPGASPFRVLEFSSSASLSHGTHLILLGAASRKTQPGDVGIYVHEGSSDVWREILFNRADGTLATGAQTITSTAAGNLLTITSTDAGAGDGPDLNLFRDSASPAANDFIGQIKFTGRDSAGNATSYGVMAAQILTTTDGAEDSLWLLRSLRAGAATDIVVDKGAMRTTALTEKGAGTINFAGMYVSGEPVGPTVSFSADKGGAGAVTLTSATPVQITFGTENWDTGSYFASNAWTPPAGKYRINASVQIDTTNAVAKEAVTITLRKAGNAHRSIEYRRVDVSLSMTVTIDAIVDASGTDAFTIFVTKAGAGNGATTATAEFNFFQGTAL